jgi:RNA polymerase sigma-70 factor (ECF subfamily)
MPPVWPICRGRDSAVWWLMASDVARIPVSSTRRRRLFSTGSKSSGDSDVVSYAVGRARQGDRAALEYLYLHFAADVQRCVQGIVFQAHDAEDVTHNVFVKLLGGLDRYEERESPFSAWLLQVARNAALDHLRRRRAVPSGQVHPTPLAERNPETADILREAFETLPAQQRVVLFLRHVVGLSPAEIAARLDKTERAVRNLHYRGRGALEAELRRVETTPATLASEHC